MADNALIAKARAIYGNMLTADSYNVLVHKGTIAAALAFLKTKPLYSAVFSDIDETAIHREQAEALIEENIYHHYQRLCRASSGDRSGIMSFYTKRLECDQLIKAVIAVSSGAQEEYVNSFPEYIDEKLSFDLMELAMSDDLRSVSEAIRGTIYHKYIAPLLNEREPDINRIITTINSCYIKWAFEQIDRKEHGRERERLKEFFLRKADTDNLLICLRLKMLGVDNERIRTFLVPFRKRLGAADISEALRANDPVAALNNLFISKKIAVNRISEIPEINVDAADRAYFRRCLVFSMNETESLYSLIMLMKTEAANLFRIIEGLRYGVAPEEIEKFLTV